MSVKTREVEYKHIAATVPFGEIDTPGAYLTNWSGHLIRIPEDGVKQGRSPVIEICGKEPMLLTRLSDDPFIGMTKARMLAADLDLPVNF